MKKFNKILIPEITNQKTGVVGLTDELNAMYISNINKKNIVVVCSSLFEASNLFQSLSNYNNDVLFFPMDDFLSSEAIELNPEFLTTRIETLSKLAVSKKQNIVVTNLMGYLRFLPTIKDWEKSYIKLQKDKETDYDELIKKLYNLGYERNSIVSATGEMGIRGFIIDVFPINFENPIRIEFFDNTIESIRSFDVDSQKSIKELNEVELLPFSEFILQTSEEQPREQKYLTKYTKPVNISAYLTEPIVIYKDFNLIDTTSKKIKTDISEYSNEKNESELVFMSKLEDLAVKQEIYLMNFDNLLTNIQLDEIYEYKSIEADNYYGDFERLNRNLKESLYKGKTVVICLRNSGEVRTVYEYLNPKDCIITNENELHENKINIIEKDIGQGFEIDNLIAISNYELFKTKERKINYRNDYKYGTKIGSLDKLEIGDYVVHSVHGIGIYKGIKVLTKNDIKKDYIEVQYRNDDKLYIPVEKINLISKYSSKDGVPPKINKLGTSDWAKTKLNVRKRIENIAGKLLKLYAIREAEKGIAYGPDTEEQILFDKEFMYEPTRDQLIAIDQIKKDMEAIKPMDRLLCGDVGFGKTEVAFRAIFKAVSYSKQVMYLCPTTILSNQQYESAKERFKNYPVNIALLNRFSTTSEVRQVLMDFEKGKIDVLFGTHRILSGDVKPSNLGFLVIDEEQRFGVTHKEKIKEFKNNIDVLTLSATPIPRTLQMSMVGIRNLSLIETPPVNRYPISTYVTPYNKQVIKEAIYSELSRGGQVFILYNKISDIKTKMAEIQSLVKEARITYAHGGMAKTDLENRMIKFINHEYDILVCTTIIETGIDIPNVNTLIIIDANNFGLSQLYQIRGRVGRTNKIAFAYLMYNPNKVLTETAIKRLKTIKDFTHLGSGFRIASRDLAIRGAGDILGSEQAGFIDAIGIELYIRMLNEEVAKLQGIETVVEEDIDEERSLLEIETHIKPEYVDDNDLKIEIHRIINEITSFETLLQKKDILEDRFGKITEEMYVYMHECWFEKSAKTLGIKNVIQTKKQVEIGLPKKLSSEIDGQKLFFAATDISMNFRFAYRNGQIKIILDTNKLEQHFIYYLIKLLEIIKGL